MALGDIAKKTGSLLAASTLFSGYSVDKQIGTGGIPFGFGALYSGTHKRSGRKVTMVMFSKNDLTAANGEVKQVVAILEKELEYRSRIGGTVDSPSAYFAPIMERKVFSNKKYCGIVYGIETLFSLQDVVYAFGGRPIMPTPDEQSAIQMDDNRVSNNPALINQPSYVSPVEARTPPTLRPFAQVFRKERILAALANIAFGLEVAHSVGLVMTMLSPASILITPDGQWQMIGLGLAQTVAQADDTNNYNAVGTAIHEFSQLPAAGPLGSLPLAWCSPEVITQRKFYATTDVFNLALLIRQVAGVLHDPFSCDSPMTPLVVAANVMRCTGKLVITSSTFDAFVQSAAQSFTAGPRSCDSTLAQTCLSMLSRQPEARISANDVCQTFCQIDPAADLIRALFTVQYVPSGQNTDGKAQFLENSLLTQLNLLHKSVLDTTVLNCIRILARDDQLHEIAVRTIITLMPLIDQKLFVEELVPFLVALAVAATNQDMRTSKAKGILKGEHAKGLPHGTGVICGVTPNSGLYLSAAAIMAAVPDICLLQAVADELVLTVFIPFMRSSFSSADKALQTASFRALTQFFLQPPHVLIMDKQKQGEERGELQHTILISLLCAVVGTEKDPTPGGPNTATNASVALSMVMGNLTDPEVDEIALRVFSFASSMTYELGYLSRAVFLLGDAIRKRMRGVHVLNSKILPALIPHLEVQNITQAHKSEICDIAQSMFADVISNSRGLYEQEQPALAQEATRTAPSHYSFDAPTTVNEPARSQGRQKKPQMPEPTATQHNPQTQTLPPPPVPAPVQPIYNPNDPLGLIQTAQQRPAVPPPPAAPQHNKGNSLEDMLSVMGFGAVEDDTPSYNYGEEPANDQQYYGDSGNQGYAEPIHEQAPVEQTATQEQYGHDSGYGDYTGGNNDYNYGTGYDSGYGGDYGYGY